MKVTPASTELLLSIVTSMGEADGLESALRRALDYLAEACRSPYGEAWLAGKDGLLERRVIRRTGNGPHPLDSPEATLRIAPGIGLTGQVFASRETRVSREIPQDDPRAELAKKAGLHAAIAAPLLAGRRPLGVLTFFLPDAHFASPEAIALLRIAAGHIGEVVCRKQIEHEYARTLERSNRELESFAAIASHDLQEPIRKVRAFADRLHAGYAELLPPDAVAWLRKIEASGALMQTMVDELLAYSRLESSNVEMETVDLAAVMADALSILEGAINGAHAQVTVAGELPRVRGNAGMLRSLFQNLIGNALKFHPADAPPRISVSAETRADGTCRIAVADDGIGFDPKHAEKIFGMFQRLHPRSEFSGTGMGLAICRRIAERHDGEISATSRPGSGSTFNVVPPLAKGTT